MERRPHPSDRRANRLYLTPKGRATLARLVPLGREISSDVLASFNETEAGELLQKLLRIKSNIRKSTAANGQTSRRGGPSCWLSRQPTRASPCWAGGVARSKLHALWLLTDREVG